MSVSRTFLALSQEQLASAIRTARQRVIYAAPGVSLDVASALIMARERLGDGEIAVLLDVSENALRLGYGVVEAITDLRSQGVPIRDASGLRIAFMVVDDEGFVFVLPPLLVEEAKHDDRQPNAVRASAEQVTLLVEAVLPKPTQMQLSRRSGPTPGSSSQHTAEMAAQAEIAQSTLTPAHIKSVETAIAVNPVENFDLARIVNVFSAYIQFFEFEVRGAQVQNQTVQLPKHVLASIKDKRTRERINAAFKLVASDSKVSGIDIRAKAAEVRRRFIRHHPIYGGVVLKSSRKVLEAEIAKLETSVRKHSDSVRNRFDTDATRSIKQLVKAFWRDIARNPPDDLADQLGRARPTTEEAKEYLERILVAAFPTAGEVADGMKITTVIKDVTWATLQNSEFVEWLERAFPMRKDLQQPFELYKAAKAAVAAKL